MVDVVEHYPQPIARLKKPSIVMPALALTFAAIGIGIPNAVGSALLMTLLVQATINAIFATSVGALLRFNGVITFGHAAFFGMAAYIFALGVSRTGMPVEFSLLLALFVPFVVALLLGLGIVGIPGTAFSMLTLAVGQATYEFAMKARGITGGEDGFDIRLPSTIFGIDSGVFQSAQSMFVICWIVLTLVILGTAGLMRTPFGRVAVAIRENEERARFIGYGTRVRRAIVFALSAFIAGLAGVLSVLYSAYVSPEMLHWSASGAALVMVIVGGPKLLWGPAFGAFIFFFLKDVLGNFTEHWQATIGVMLILVTLLIPQGIGGLLAGLLLNFTGRRKH
jgi:branched-chain amino acid transport system permease protein